MRKIERKREREGEEIEREERRVREGEEGREDEGRKLDDWAGGGFPNQRNESSLKQQIRQDDIRKRQYVKTTSQKDIFHLTQPKNAIK